MSTCTWTPGRGLAAAAVAAGLAVSMIAAPGVASDSSTGSPRVGPPAPWGPGELVAVAQPDIYSDAPWPWVEVGWDGTAVATWFTNLQPRRPTVTVSMRRETGGWSDPVLVSPQLRSQYADVDVAAGAEGRASVVWEHFVDGAWQVEHAQCTASGCGEPVVVGPGRAPQVAVDRRGRVTVAWRSAGTLSLRRGNEAGHWGRTRTVPARHIFHHEVTANGSGDVVVSWTTWRTVRVRALLRRLGSGWDKPVTLMRGSRVVRTRALLDSRGRAMVTWSTSAEWDRDRRRYRNGIAWARADGGGTWRRTRYYNRSLGEDGRLVDVAMNPRGDGLAVWYAGGGPTGGAPFGTYSARFDSTGWWGPTHRLHRHWDVPVAAAVGADRVARVVGDHGRWTRSAEHRFGEGWSAWTRLVPEDLSDASGGRSRLVMLWVAEPVYGGLPLWASVLDTTR